MLLRSGLKNPNIGRGLRLHPATAVFGIFDEEIRPWEGTMQALYSDQHRHLDGGYGIKYETVPAHPALLTAAVPWDGAAEHARLMASLPRLSGIAVIPRDRGSGRVRIGRDGEPIATYRLAPDDARRLATGVDGAGRIMAAAGAREVFSANARLQRFTRRLSRRRVPLRPRPRRALLLPHHGLGPDGRLAGDVGGERGGRDVGGAEPRRRGRLGVSDRLRRESDDHDRGDRAPERAPPGGEGSARRALRRGRRGRRRPSRRSRARPCRPAAP